MAEIPSSDVLRMLAVRTVQSVSSDNLASNFVTSNFFDDIDATTLSNISANGAILRESLLSYVGESNQRAASAVLVIGFNQNSSLAYGSIDALNTKFPAFADVQDWLADNLATTDYNTAVSAIESALNENIVDFLADADYLENKVRLWDNLFAEVVTPSDPSLREAIIKYIRLHELLERADALTGTVGLEAMQNAFSATVVLPKPIFPFPRLENDLPEAGETAVDNSAEAAAELAALQAITDLEAARTELLETRNRQALSVRPDILVDPTFIGDNSDPDFSDDFVKKDANRLKSTFYDALSTSTKNILTTDLEMDTENMDIPFALQAVERRLTALGRETFNRPAYDQIVQIGSTLISINSLCNEEIAKDPCDPNRTVDLPEGYGNVKPLGIGDLLVIRQQLLKYELGEIAHIENVMPTEERSRTHRSLSRSEETLSTTTESTTETERDTQTTERHSLEKEISNVVSQDTNKEAGVTVTAYGPHVSLTAGASYSSSNSQQQATSQAREYSREVTERAAERVREFVREQRTVTKIREIEETNVHGFDNTMTGSDNVVGMYHWVDKYYHNQLWTFGKRLLFEFMVPEPAAFHIYSKANSKTEGGIVKPIAPDSDRNPIGTLYSFEDITVSNYAHWASYYGVRGITPPPPAVHYLTAGYNQDAIPDSDFPTMTAELEIPEGYAAVSLKAQVGFSDSAAGATVMKYVRMFVGKLGLIWYNSGLKDGYLDFVTGKLPVSIQVRETYYIVNLEVTCMRTDEAFKAWQIEVFEAVKDAYENQQRDYENLLRANAFNVANGIAGTNPAQNREVEKLELKKGCIEILTNQRFEAFDAMYNNVPTDGYPEFDQPEALAEGAYIRFFEQAFEWTRMTYIFYPYFWGRKPNWTTVKNYNDTDPLFQDFLQAGAGKVQLSVRPGYEDAVLHYLNTGEIWSGGEVPTIDDPLYLSIIDEIREAEDMSDGQPMGEPWVTKIPTALVMLQPDNPPVLPDNSIELGMGGA